MMTLTKDGDVHVLVMQNGENTIDLEFLRELNGHLDEVEKESDGACALVLTAEGKFFCNGLDLTPHRGRIAHAEERNRPSRPS